MKSRKKRSLKACTFWAKSRSAIISRTAKSVAEAGAKAGVKHMITQNYRFGAQPRTTRKVLADGLIGSAGQCDVRFYMPWADMPGSHYVTEPFMLINDMMVHHFDLMRYVLQARSGRRAGHYVESAVGLAHRRCRARHRFRVSQ